MFRTGDVWGHICQGTSPSIWGTSPRATVKTLHAWGFIGVGTSPSIWGTSPSAMVKTWDVWGHIYLGTSPSKLGTSRSAMVKHVMCEGTLSKVAILQRRRKWLVLSKINKDLYWILKAAAWPNKIKVPRKDAKTQSIQNVIKCWYCQQTYAYSIVENTKHSNARNWQ